MALTWLYQSRRPIPRLLSPCQRATCSASKVGSLSQRSWLVDRRPLVACKALWNHPGAANKHYSSQKTSALGRQKSSRQSNEQRAPARPRACHVSLDDSSFALPLPLELRCVRAADGAGRSCDHTPTIPIKDAAHTTLTDAGALIRESRLCSCHNGHSIAAHPGLCLGFGLAPGLSNTWRMPESPGCALPLCSMQLVQAQGGNRVLEGRVLSGLDDEPEFLTGKLRQLAGTRADAGVRAEGREKGGVPQ
eukprot:scaffold28361_cov129-Isochrysis_galbana.AAC.3